MPVALPERLNRLKYVNNPRPEVLGAWCVLRFAFCIRVYVVASDSNRFGCTCTREGMGA